MSDARVPASRPVLRGQWTFDEGAGENAADSSGNGHDLTANGRAVWTARGKFGGAVSLDASRSWSTAGPVLRTDEDFSVVAWVRLAAVSMTAGVALPPGEFALTAVSQSGPSHSAFYLGTRLIPTPQPDGSMQNTLRWNFTAAPVDGSMTGAIEWQHAAATTPIDESMLDEWVLLVGVYDLTGRVAHIYVPGTGDDGSMPLPDNWTYWSAEDGVQIGFGRYLDGLADPWPGSVGPVRAFQGVLTAQDAADLYANDALSNA